MKALQISLFFAISFLSFSVWADTDINEYETDLYYANGMGMELSERQAERVWETRVKNTELPHSLLKY